MANTRYIRWSNCCGGVQTVPATPKNGATGWRGMPLYTPPIPSQSFIQSWPPRSGNALVGNCYRKTEGDCWLCLPASKYTNGILVSIGKRHRGNPGSQHSFTRRPQCKLNRQVRLWQSVQTLQFTLPFTPASRNCSEANQSNWEVSKMHRSHTHKHFLFDESNGDACRFHRPLSGGIILATCGQRIPSQQYPESLQTPLADERLRFEAEWRIA